MAEIVVEKEICNACGVEAREGALFCYNCGGSLSPEINTKAESDVIGDSNQEKNSKNGKRDKLKLVEKPEVFGEAEDLAGKSETRPEDKENTQLKSAAALRKRPKSIQKKPVEIVWKEHENAPNLWFIAVTIILTLFVLGIVWLALYFK